MRYMVIFFLFNLILFGKNIPHEIKLFTSSYFGLLDHVNSIEQIDKTKYKVYGCVLNFIFEKKDKHFEITKIEIKQRIKETDKYLLQDLEIIKKLIKEKRSYNYIFHYKISLKFDCAVTDYNDIIEENKLIKFERYIKNTINPKKLSVDNIIFKNKTYFYVHYNDSKNNKFFAFYDANYKLIFKKKLKEKDCYLNILYDGNNYYFEKIESSKNGNKYIKEKIDIKID